MYRTCYIMTYKREKSQTYHDQIPSVFIVTKLMVIDCDKYLSLTEERSTNNCLDEL